MEGNRGLGCEIRRRNLVADADADRQPISTTEEKRVEYYDPAQPGRSRQAMTQPIRLLCIGMDFGGGGAERVHLQFFEEIDRRVFIPTVYVLRKGGVLEKDIPEDLNLEFGMRMDQWKPWKILLALRRLISLARRSDLVFGMLEGTPAYLAVIAGFFAKKPTAIWIHVSWSSIQKIKRRGHGLLSRLLYPRAGLVVAVSEGVASDLRNYLGGQISQHRVPNIVVRTNPIDFNRIARMAEQPIPLDATTFFSRPTLIAVGRLKQQKAFDVLIESFFHAASEGGDWNLVILGEGPERPLLERQIKRAGLEERVFMPGFVENPYSYMKRAQLFVLSSRYEGLPLVLIEALSLKLPVIATDCPSGPREILKFAPELLVPPDDVTALSKAISRSMASHPNAEKFTALARDVRSIHDPKQTYQLLQKNLTELFDKAKK